MIASDDEAPALPPPLWALALTVTLTLAVSYMDRQTFAVLAPTIQDRLHISDSARRSHTEHVRWLSGDPGWYVVDNRS